jgi:hypothetical protein
MFDQVVQIQEKVRECPFYMKTILEIYFWSMHSDEAIHFFRYRKDITAFQCDPDEVLKEVLKKFAVCGEQSVGYAHSTSWRYEAGHILLTYLVWCPDQIMAAWPVRKRVLVCDCEAHSTDALTPRPRKIEESQVLAHGLRHLRFLMAEKQDPLIEQALDSISAKEMLYLLKPALAGRI